MLSAMWDQDLKELALCVADIFVSCSASSMPSPMILAALQPCMPSLHLMAAGRQCHSLACEAEHCSLALMYTEHSNGQAGKQTSKHLCMQGLLQISGPLTMTRLPACLGN